MVKEDEVRRFWREVAEVVVDEDLCRLDNFRREDGCDGLLMCRKQINRYGFSGGQGGRTRLFSGVLGLS
jgi:hypothetical protein